MLVLVFVSRFVQRCSVRINDRPRRDEQNKKIAYLVDLRTIAVYDFTVNAQVATVDHDARVDWCVVHCDHVFG